MVQSVRGRWWHPAIRQPMPILRSTLGEYPLHLKRNADRLPRREPTCCLTQSDKIADRFRQPCMQFHRFDLNLLIALDTLLREKNITRAAEKVFVLQPAMSAALHRLRDYFDDPLLVRVGRDMELSPRGQSLVDPVREALLLIQTALGSQPTFTAATTQREFTLIMSEEAVPDLLPAITERVSTDAPGIRINIELVSHRALDRLEYGEVDL